MVPSKFFGQLAYDNSIMSRHQGSPVAPKPQMGTDSQVTIVHRIVYMEFETLVLYKSSISRNTLDSLP
jgi:hypothetical protein